MDRFYVGISPFIRNIRQIAGKLLPHVQGFKVYRNLVKRLIKVKILYKTESDEPCGKCILTINNGRIVGRTTINNFLERDSEYHGWWIFGMWVNWRYRRLGIGRRLTEMACDSAAKSGASEVKLLVFKDNRPAISIYREMGFHQISIPLIDEELRKEAKRIRRKRIIMVRDIQMR